MFPLRKVLVWSPPLLGIGVLAFFALALWWNAHYVHQHCIKNTGLAFRIYATDHEDRYPYDTNGFGNALLLLLKEGELDPNENGVRYITGPGDDGQIFKDALRTGAHIPEESCSRIYVQGLSEKSNPDIALIFDKKSTPGGDHFRRPWGPRVRELCLVDGRMEIISDEKWPSFASNQVALLVKAGFDRKTAEHYYSIP